ncbi:hypothetical protein FHX79_114752 [Streptomyces cavourensis]|uniref:hypothetical protein n=1 Tax=Streptomyces cavourensis TaxID=67258 RepID=UPI00114E3D0F|nr:hypothetical protein [Streptomyces cavourensis]TQO32872.1 hypothetical protein FHX79_114752 [Streptomyces cavourensis]WAE68571.1 hypothetical protein OUQ49_23990 [Streptomyces cavourensis]GGU55849.1 hypothetical protein GCM10010498_11200 [Streptomyces cavourensis]
MMPVIEADRVTAGQLASNIEVFGGPEPGDSTVRVAVRVSAHLSFADLLGLLTFEGELTWGELGDDAVVRESLQYAVLNTTLDTMEAYARRAMAALRGEPKPGDAGDPNIVRFVRAVAVAVTRAFGVAEPEGSRRLCGGPVGQVLEALSMADCETW